MGGRGNAGERNSSSSTPATRYNEQGFEVENNNSPEVEFTDRVWKEMAELRKYFDAFEDPDLASDVDNRISELVDQYGDLENYDSDLTTLREHLERENVTSDEYWAGYHVMADWLNIRPQRYTVWDSDMSPWDERFTSEEQAADWANQREDAKYIYDRWTRKYRKIGGKNWRS